MGWKSSINILFFSVLLIAANKCKAELLLKAVSNSSEIINEREFYVPVGDTVNIQCIYSTNFSSQLNCSNLLWETKIKPPMGENSASFNNYCVILLSINKVLWLGKKMFRCRYEGKENRSLSVVSGLKPKQIQQSQPKLEWVEDKVEITWVPTNDSYENTERYMVEYKGASEGYSTTNNFLSTKCGWFKVNNCNEEIVFHCKASFFALLGAEYNIRITAENNFGKQIGKWLNITIPIYQDKTTPEPVSNLTIFLMTEVIRLEWNNALYDFRKRISFKCLGNKTMHNMFTTNSFYEISKKQLPAFLYCKFCVSRQKYEHGQFSCLTCRKLRTFESNPEQSAKLLSCQSCYTSSSNKLRNITVSWELPQKKYWNGILNRQILFFYASSDRVLKNVTIDDANKTTCTLNNMRDTDEYCFYIVICTVAGCSEKSNFIYVSPLPTSDTDFHLFSNRANTGIFIGVTLAALTVFFVIIFIILYIKRHKGERLPPLQEPNIVEQGTNQPSQNEVEYNMLEKRDGKVYRF